MVSSHPDFIILDKQITTISTQRRWIHQTQPQIPGISEEERQRRRESNKLSTRINFVGWILEVELPNWDSPRAKLNIQYLFIVTTCNFPVKFVVEWILEVEFFFAQFETMVIHIYQWNVWPRITHINYQARARARRACALRALGLLLADGAPTVGRGKTFWQVN